MIVFDSHDDLLPQSPCRKSQFSVLYDTSFGGKAFHFNSLWLRIDLVLSPKDRELRFRSAVHFVGFHPGTICDQHVDKSFHAVRGSHRRLAADAGQEFLLPPAWRAGAASPSVSDVRHRESKAGFSGNWTVPSTLARISEVTGLPVPNGLGAMLLSCRQGSGSKTSDELVTWCWHKLVEAGFPGMRWL